MRARGRALFAAGLAAAVLVGVLLRLCTREQVSAGGRIRAISSDCYYHLRRARFAAAHFPRTVTFDPLMNFPEGGLAIWPPLYDLALAAPARLLHGPNADPARVEWHAAWIPLLFAAGGILLAGILGRRLAGEGAGVAAAFFLAACPAHIQWSQYGHTDQHVAESFFGLLCLVLFLAARERPDGPRSAQWEAAAGAALALATLTWQGAIFWGAIFAACLFGEILWTRKSRARAALLTLGLPAVLLAVARVAWFGLSPLPFTYISFGDFQPAFLAALAAGLLALDALLLAVRGGAPARRLALGLLPLAAAAALLLLTGRRGASALLDTAGHLFRGGEGKWAPGAYLAYPGQWLQSIFEYRPLLSEGLPAVARQLSGAFFLSPLVVVFWIWRAARGRRPGVHLALSVWGAVTLLLALSQKRYVYYAAPLAAVTLIEAVRLGSTRLRRALPRAARPRRLLTGLALTLALALPLVSGLRRELTLQRVPGSDLFETLAWMRRETPQECDPYDPRFLRLRDAGDVAALGRNRVSSVLGPWSLGHLILYEAERPVVANNFGYGFFDSIAFFLAESEEEALAIARSRRARWVLATDLVPRINDYASFLGRSPYLRETPAGLEPTRAYFSTLQSRLYDFDGRGARLEGLTVEPLTRIRLVHRSRSAIRRGGRWIALWKVFEILPDQRGP